MYFISRLHDKQQHNIKIFRQLGDLLSTLFWAHSPLEINIIVISSDINIHSLW